MKTLALLLFTLLPLAAHAQYCSSNTSSDGTLTTSCSDGDYYSQTTCIGGSCWSNSGKKDQQPYGYVQVLCLSCGPGETLRSHTQLRLCLTGKWNDMCRAYMQESHIFISPLFERLRLYPKAVVTEWSQK